MRRTDQGLIPVGNSTDALSRFVRARMRRNDIALERIQERIRKRVAERLGVEESQVRLDSHFVDDLGADSLDVVELVMAVEEEFGVDIDVE